MRSSTPAFAAAGITRQSSCDGEGRILCELRAHSPHAYEARGDVAAQLDVAAKCRRALLRQHRGYFHLS